MAWQAKWIWAARDKGRQYNDTIRARRTFDVGKASSATLRITADTYYRLYINGEWVGDGPCRSWPNHYQYDVIDVLPHLHEGENTIEVIAKHYGIGTFHVVPKQPGLLAQLDAMLSNGEAFALGTDAAWQTRTAHEFVRDVPKSSVQMNLFEQIDARLAEQSAWEAAVEICGPEDGPWKNLIPRDVALLTREPFPLSTFQHAKAVASDWRCYDFNLAALLYDKVVYANNNVSMAHGIATVLENDKPLTLSLPNSGYSLTVNGERGRGNLWELQPGRHLIFGVLDRYFTHWSTDMWIRFEPVDGFTLINPLDSANESPWALVPCDDLRFSMADYKYGLLSDEEKTAYTRKVRRVYREMQGAATSPESFAETLAADAIAPPPGPLTMDEVNQQFQDRRILDDVTPRVESPEALLSGDERVTVVHPADGADIELLYDLGEQNCGFYHLDLEAPVGTIVDIFGVEYIRESDGAVQHTGTYRNGMRYICTEGRNVVHAYRRRSQRHVFIILRAMTGPVRIRHAELIESTYPCDFGEGFSCSDPSLTEIWDISARTLKLCMEDTYTDCPLYEQTLWVGDARNEGLYALECLGAYDITERCIRLAAESLEHYPIVLCQVPSTWEKLLPNWSFLWVISVHDYYQWTGNLDVVKRTWPAIMQNMKGAEGFVGEQDLFNAPFWNFFDWSGIDDGHSQVLHNSMFLCGAAKKARELALVLGEDADEEWLGDLAMRLTRGVNAAWDEERGAYPDSIHDDGTPSPKTCIHSHFLALLYGIAREDIRDRVATLVEDPPEDMTRVGSPFAIQYLYETFDQLGEPDRIIASIRENYQPMLDLGATTVWESFSTGTTGGGAWPTRSHCHAWSSSPMLFFNRILLGIRPSAPGFAECDISPRPNGLTHAEGFAVTPKGKLSVAWKIEDRTLAITCDAPGGIDARFRRNDAIAGLDVTWNGAAI